MANIDKINVSPNYEVKNILHFTIRISQSLYQACYSTLVFLRLYC